MSVLLRYLFLASVVLLSGCLSAPQVQIAHITSDTDRELGLGVTGSDFNVSFENRTLDSTEEDRTALTNWFFIPGTDSCDRESVNAGNCVAATGGVCRRGSIAHLNFVSNLRGNEQGTAVWSQVESSGQFPNTSTALRQLREKYASQTDGIELLISFGSMSIERDSGGTPDIGHFEAANSTAFAGLNSVVGKYKPVSDTQMMTLSVVGVPGFREPVPVASTALKDMRVIFNFLGEEDKCKGQNFYIEPFNIINPEDPDASENNNLEALKAFQNITDLDIALVAIGLAQDTRDKKVSYCFVIPEHVSINTGGSPVVVQLGVPGPYKAPNPVAYIATGLNGCEYF
ncbi:hypothetical protein [Endozoicomonas arenosclerae]|uniref:hypothetical protein n=1 Tax=Endozoicomonas arenosclerae TaxID=1633495 RepID=UPI000785C25F|nr:hypothetical protein [Endozoicomonas arenosclerae]